jgi:hypothetical protein
LKPFIIKNPSSISMHPSPYMATLRVL